MEVVTLVSAPGPTESGYARWTASHPMRTGPYSSVAIGSFDGVHLGHRQVLAGCDTVLTFEPHPMRVLAPRRAPCMLSDPPTKLRKLAALGIRRTVIIRFDETWSRLAANEFVERVLLGRLGARIISVGSNFRFGAGGTGSAATFADYPWLQTRVIPLVTGGHDGQPISSTRIRQLVARGEVEDAAALLGGPLILPALAVDDERLTIAEEFAVPSVGDYHGSVDGRPTMLRVADDVITCGEAPLRAGATVAVAFLQRRE